jgi:hypothetical protein
MARCGLSLGVKRDKLTGDLANRLARLRFRVGPDTAADSAEPALLAAELRLLSRDQTYAAALQIAGGLARRLV